MSREERFNSENWLVPASTPRRPVTASDLLRDLGVESLPIGEQRAAVKAWVAAKGKPDPVLFQSLKRAGLFA